MYQNLLIHRQNFFHSKRKSSVINLYGLKNVLIFLTLFYSSSANAQRLLWLGISNTFERQSLKAFKNNVFVKCVDCYSDSSAREALFQRQIVTSCVFIANNNRTINITTIFVFLVFLTLFFVGLLFYKRKTKTLAKKDSFVPKLQEDSEKNNKLDQKDIDFDDVKTPLKCSITISEETSNAILKKIIKFENSEKFLRKDINLTWLSNHLNTNTKYLSEVIKTHSNKNFNNYINGLRIAYITKKLYEDPVYREYKISYLSKECGFASPQVFVIAFKKEKNVTPSYFIEQLKNQTKDRIEAFYRLNGDV